MYYEKWWVIISYSLSSLHSWLPGCIIALSVISLLRWKLPSHTISPCTKIVRNPRSCFPHFPRPSWVAYIHFNSTWSKVPSVRSMGEHCGSPRNDTLCCALHSLPKHASHCTYCLRFVENYPGWLHHLLHYSRPRTPGGTAGCYLCLLTLHASARSYACHCMTLPLSLVYSFYSSLRTFLFLTTLKNTLSPVTFSPSLLIHFKLIYKYTKHAWSHGTPLGIPSSPS